MKELKIIGTTNINNTPITHIEGGFGENQKCILVKDVAVKHKQNIKEINRLINRNISKFNENDIIDFLSGSEALRDFAKENGLIGSNRTQNVYLLSERGYIKLVSMMDNSNETKWEVMNEIIDNYFSMREEIQTTTKEKLLLQLFSQDALQVANAHKALVEMETKPLKETIAIQAPKVEFYDTVTGSEDTIDMAQVAKTLNMGIGRNKIFEILREKKILQKNNQPYQSYVDRGYFRCIESSFIKPNGDTCVYIKTVVFQKGLDFIRKTLNEYK